MTVQEAVDHILSLSTKNEIPMQEKQYSVNGDLYYCPECDHVLTVREGKIIDSSCRHASLNYIPVGPKQFIKMITNRPHVLREGYQP